MCWQVTSAKIEILLPGLSCSYWSDVMGYRFQEKMNMIGSLLLVVAGSAHQCGLLNYHWWTGISLFSNGLVHYLFQSRYDLGESMKQVNFDMFLKFQARSNRKTCENTSPLNMRIGCVCGEGLILKMPQDSWLLVIQSNTTLHSAVKGLWRWKDGINIPFFFF